VINPETDRVLITGTVGAIGTALRASNELRTHQSLGKDAPTHRPIQRLGRLAARPILGGLHHQYCRM
jgi:hypothetical protein